MYEPKMELTLEQREILEGKQGPVLAKIMETVTMFGDIFGAPRLVKSLMMMVTWWPASALNY